MIPSIECTLTRVPRSGDLRLLAGGLQAAEVRELRLPGLGGRVGVDAGTRLHDTDTLLGHRAGHATRGDFQGGS